MLRNGKMGQQGMLAAQCLGPPAGLGSLCRQFLGGPAPRQSVLELEGAEAQRLRAGVRAESLRGTDTEGVREDGWEAGEGGETVEEERGRGCRAAVGERKTGRETEIKEQKEEEGKEGE